MTIDALAPFRWLRPPYGDRGDLLGEIYCVTLLRGLDPAEVLRRFGARTSTEMSFAELDLAVSDFTMVTGGGEGGGHVGVVATGDGCAAVEPSGWSGTDDPTLARLPAGTDVVSVLRHDYACDYFHYAADGVVITAFDPIAPEHRWKTFSVRHPDTATGAPLGVVKKCFTSRQRGSRPRSTACSEGLRRVRRVDEMSFGPAGGLSGYE